MKLNKFLFLGVGCMLTVLTFFSFLKFVSTSPPIMETSGLGVLLAIVFLTIINAGLQLILLVLCFIIFRKKPTINLNEWIIKKEDSILLKIVKSFAYMINIYLLYDYLSTLQGINLWECLFYIVMMALVWYYLIWMVHILIILGKWIKCKNF